MTALPASIGVGSEITVIMTVTNNGQATANAVTPTGFAIIGSASYVAVNGPLPTNATITSGTSASFTWRYAAVSTGSLYFTANASGLDGNNAAYTVSTSVTAQSNPVNIYPTDPILTSWVTVSPQVINYNQRFTVIMSVSNVGIVAANGTIPNVIPTVLSSSLMSGPVPAFVDIPVGGFAQFTWVFESAMTAGTANPTVIASSAGFNSTDITTLSASQIQVIADPMLAHDIIVSPAVVSVGQNITIRMHITNSGASEAQGVVPAALSKLGNGNYTYVSGPAPASQTVAAGANVYFTWIYQSSGAGSLAVNGYATGYSQYSKATKTAAAEDSNYITIQSPASLTSSISIPATKNIGQWFTVTMTVTNNGTATANAVAPPSNLTVVGTGGAVRMSGPEPPSAAIIGGTSQVYQWTYSAAGAGTVTFAGIAAGTDANSGAAVASNNAVSTNFVIQTGANLSVAISAAPAVAGTGYPITVTGIITNNGQATANNVRMNELNDAAVSGGNATLTTGVVPSAGVILTGGASAYFTWTYTANTIGTINFTGIATGVDGNTNLGVTSTAATSNNVEIRNTAFLTADLSALPLSVSAGQRITVLMHVTNTGAGDANGLTGVNMTPSGTGSVSYVSGPVPVTQSIAAGADTYLTWVYTAMTAGNISFNAGARAVDVNIGNTINSAAAVSNAVIIETPASLAASMNAYPSLISAGQQITVLMTVTNNGTADAVSVLPVTPSASVPSSVSIITLPASVTIPGGASSVFTWVFDSTAPGNVVFTSKASGLDENTLNTISSAQVSSNEIVIQAPAAIAASISASPSAVALGSNVTVIMTVTNSGTASANAVIPAGFGFSGSASLVYVSGPVPTNATITAGASSQFTWVYATVGLGSLTFSSNASGTDFNSGMPVSTTYTAYSNIVNVYPNNPVMTSFVTVSPSIVNYNQNYTVRLTVSNVGVQAANGTFASPLNPAPVLGGTLQSSVNPTSADIPAGGTAVFTWVYRSATTAGTASYSIIASSGGYPSTNVTSGTANQIQVVADPVLANEMIVTPSVASVGQNITVMLSVTNSGGSISEGTVPAPMVKLGSGSYSYISGPSPVSASIAAGASAVYTWVYQATGAGTLAVNNYATGYSQYSKLTITAAADDSNYVTILTPASLASSISAPATKNIGQWFTVIMTVTNNGQSAANSVAPPMALNLIGDGGAVRINGPAPAAAVIAGNSSAAFTWTYSAAGSGSVIFSGNASGIDSSTGAAVSSIVTNSNLLKVQTPASLGVSVSAMPAVLGTGYMITVVVDVTNNGQATANNVSVTAVDDIQISGGNAELSSGVLPSAGVTLTAAATARFTWVYSAQAVGTIAFTAAARGTDVNNPAEPVISNIGTSANVVIKDAAYLVSDIQIIPSTVSVGQQVTIIMNVTNTGAGGTSDVIGQNIVTTGSASLVYVSGPVPSATPIPGNAAPIHNQFYTWIYTANTPGFVSVSGNAKGIDETLGNTITSSVTGSNVLAVESAVSLAAQLSVSPVQVSAGQIISVIMTVTNNGQADAVSVLPITPTSSIVGTAAIFESPAAVTIPGGASAVFMWSYTTQGSGTVIFTSAAFGTDENSGLVKTSAQAASNALIIQSPAALTASINANPASLGTGNNITVVMTVSNNGQAAANAVTHAGFMAVGSAGIVAVSTPEPATANISGGSSGYFTWVYAATSVGSIYFTADGQGTDFNSGAIIATTITAQSNTVLVQPNFPVLSSWISVAPQTINYNQRYTVIMSVSNSGIITANTVTPDTYTVPLSGTTISGPIPANANLAPGERQDFTYVLSSAGVAGISNVTMTASSGIYTSTDISNPAGMVINVIANPALAQDITLQPAVASVGQRVTIIMNVTNSGASTAEGVVPSALIKLGTASYTLAQSPVPASVNIAAGASASFTWAYTATGAGSLAVNAYSKGYAQYSKTTVTATAVSSNFITIESPASLSSALSIDGTMFNIGQDVRVYMTVTNSGTAIANVVMPNPLNYSAASTGGLIPVSGPDPVSATVGTGTSAVFTWLYTAAGLGSVALSGNASGMDENSLATVNSAVTVSPVIQIQSPASLTASINASPAYLGTGENITVIMNVTNNGQSAVNGLTADPAGLILTNGGNVLPVSGPIPATMTLPGMSSAAFTWIYQANSAGTVQFTSTARGTDSNDISSLVNTGSQTSNAVEIYASAGVAISSFTALPATVSTGQQITVLMTVENAGIGNAEGVMPSALALMVSGTASASYVSGPLPSTPQNLASGSSTQFEWIYQATTPGTVWASANAVGYNEANKATITAQAAWTNNVIIQPAASLTAGLVSIPNQVSVGQIITVVMAVTNNGTAMAEGAYGVTPAASIPANALILTSPAAQDIAGGTSTHFTWTYSANASGAINFASLAIGYDFNSKITKTASAIGGNVNIQSVPVLASRVSAMPILIKESVDAITVILSVTNSGQAAITNVVPALDITGSSTPLYLTGPAPVSANISGNGGTARFTWTLSAAGVGNLIFSAYAQGTDANSGVTYGSTGNTVTVNAVSNQPVLAVTLSAPAEVTNGQNFTIIMRVDNAGLVDANNVTVSALAVTAGTATYVVGPVPSARNITVGNYGTFTYVYTAGSAGTISLEGYAWNSPVASVSTTAFEPPALSYNYMEILPIGGTFSVGQNITLTMTISNTGATNAINVAPILPLNRVGTGNATIVSGPLPSSLSITAGSSATYTWVYKTTIAGSLGYNGRAQGQDIRTGAGYQSVTGTSNMVNIEAPPVLASSISIINDTLNLGQTTNVYMTVTNSGTADAVNVAPGDIYVVNPPSTGGMWAIDGPSPLTQNIPAGAARVFTWTYSATAVGSVALSGNASGFDENSGIKISSAMNASKYIQVQLPMQLSASIIAAPSDVKTGQAITVYVTANNTGGAAAANVVPSALTLGGTGSVAYVSGPVPASAAIINGGSAFTFAYVYNSTAFGTVNFTASIDANDYNTGDPQATAPVISNDVTITDSAYLASDTSVSRSVVSTGQQITVIMTVTNVGTASTASFVTPSIQAILTGGAALTAVSQAVTSTPMAANDVVSFTWIYNPTAQGTVTFSTYASYADADGAKTTDPDRTAPVQIQRAAALTASLITPLTVNNGQIFDVTMIITNTGGANATNVIPVFTSSATGTGVTVNLAASGVTATAIAGGSSTAIVWQYQATGSGTIFFSGYASGIDENDTTNTIISPMTPQNYITVQQPAALSITAFTVYPPVVAQGQNVTVLMTVSNGGEGQVTNINPTMTATGTGYFTRITGPAPATVSLSGNQSAVFTWTYSGSAIGIVTFSGGAEGLEVNTASNIQSGPSGNVDAEVIAQQAILTAQMSLSPLVAGPSQRITINMTVSNTGLHAATGVSPVAGLLMYDNTGSLIKSVTHTAQVAPVNLAIGQAQTFRWILETDVNFGTVIFSAAAQGADAILPITVSSNTAVSEMLTIEQPPALVSRIDAYPNTVNTSQMITILMTVTNNGQADAVNVMPSQLFKSGSALANPNNPNVHSPSSAVIPGGGGVAVFTWVTQATGAGTINWLGWASGQDENSLNTFLSASTSTNVITVQSPANLSIDSIAAPSYVTVGQQFTVIMTVTNLGGASALGASANMNISSGSGGVIPMATPAAVDIAGRTTAALTWIYQASGQGDVVLSAMITATDSNTGAVITDAGFTGTINVQSPASITSDISIAPAMNYNGQIFTVSMLVNNSGQAAASSVGITPFVLTETGASAFMVTEPSPLTMTVAGGTSQIFQWTYSASGDGTITFSAYATGTDANTLDPIGSTGTEASVEIRASASLVADVSVSAAMVSTGQSVVVIMTITNTGFGSSNAYNVTPLYPVWAGGATFSMVSGPSGAAVTLTVGAAESFTWEYQATSAGTSSFSAIAYGKDSGIGDIYSSPVLSAPVTVQTSAALMSTLYSFPNSINTGSDFTVIMSVTNTGGATINNLTPQYSFTPAAGVAALSSSPAPVATFAGGAYQAFTWIFNTTAPGTIAFVGRAEGIDVNSGSNVTSAQTSAPAVVIQAPAVLVSTIETYPPATLSRSQVITVILNVTNTGGAAATGVTPTAMLISDGGSGATYELLTGNTSSVTLNGGQSTSFTWTYSATLEGQLTFGSSASGTDANSGAAIVSAPDDVTVTITEPSANLVATLDVFSPSATDRAELNETITAIMAITNTGLVSARAVTPSVMAITPVGFVTLVSGPVPAVIDTIAVGATQYITWVYEAGSNPEYLTFTASVSGTNDGTSTPASNSGVAVSDSIRITPSFANLALSINALPATVGVGDAITVIMTVTNNGQLDAGNVNPVPADLLLSGAGYASVSVTNSTLNASIPAGGSQNFTWIFTAVSGGNITFAGNLAYESYNTFTGETNTINNTDPANYVVSNVITIAFGSSTTSHNDMYFTANSFNPQAGESVGIIFSVNADSNNADLMVFNVAGERVRTMSLGPVAAGILYTQLAVWDGRADDGKLVTTGMYYIKLRDGSYEVIKPVAVIKK
jgi:hypothetical protein